MPTQNAQHLLDFSKVRAHFCLLPYNTSQEPNGNCSEKTCSDVFVFVWGGFFSGGFSAGDHCK